MACVWSMLSVEEVVEIVLTCDPVETSNGDESAELFSLLHLPHSSVVPLRSIIKKLQDLQEDNNICIRGSDPRGRT